MKLSSTSSLLLLFTSLSVGAATTTVGTSSSIHLRGGHRDDLSSSPSQDIDDIVTLSSFLMIEVVDVPMDDLSFEDRADFNYAFQQAFDTIHGDHDGLYLSGEQIDGINNVTAEDISSSSSSDIITARRRKPRWPKPTKSKYYSKWDIYLHVDMSGRCGRHCKDDDAAMMEDEDETETSLLQLLLGNSNVQQLEQQDNYSSSRLSSSSAKEEQETSEYVFDESNLDAVADEFCRLLKDSSGNKRFQNAKMCDIFILSETDYNTALTTIATNSASASVATADDNDAPEEEEDTIPADSESDSSAVSLPYFYGNKETSNNIKAADEIVGTGYLKITLNGIGMRRNRSINPLPCGVWHNDDLFDFGSSIHNAFNAIHGTTTDGIFDAGQTIDKIKCVREAEEEEDHEAATIHTNNDVDTIEDPAASAAVVGARRKSRWPKNSSHYKKWGDHFDIYLAIDMSGRCGRHCKDDDAAMMMVEDASSSFSDANEVAAAYLSEASLRDIADAAADDLIRFGNPHFRHLIDCTIENLTPSEYYTQALYNNEDHEEATTTSHAADTSTIFAVDA